MLKTMSVEEGSLSDCCPCVRDALVLYGDVPDVSGTLVHVWNVSTGTLVLEEGKRCIGHTQTRGVGSDV